MIMFLKIMVGVILVGVAMGLAYRGTRDWQRDRAEDWGHSYMKEMGIDEDKKEYRD